MSFLNPIFLLALAAAGIPLMIHLLNLRRPKKIEFSTLTFFQELKKSTIRKIKIKRLLLLIMRMLAVACLAVVLARPFLPPGLSFGGDAQAPSVNAILIDNSISMSRVGSNGPLIDYAKEVAENISEASRENDRFILQVTNGEAIYPAILNHVNMSNTLKDIEAQPSGNYMGERLQEMIRFMDESPFQQKKIFIITDAQRSQIQKLTKLEEVDSRFTIIDVGEVEVQNTVIAEVSIPSQMIGLGLPVQVNVKVENQGSVPAINQFVSLEYEGQPLGQYSVSLQPGENQVFDFEVSPSAEGSSSGRIWIEGDEFIDDNDYLFSLEIPDRRRILWIRPDVPIQSENISYTRLMLDVASENDAQFEYDEIDPGGVTGAELSEYDAFIMDGVEQIPEFLFSELQAEVQSGKGLLFFPSENGSIQNYNDFLSGFNAGRWVGISGDYASFQSVAAADELLEEHPAFTGLFDRAEGEELKFSRPSVYYYFRLDTRGSTNAFDLLRLNNGDALIHEKKFGRGTLLISAIGNDPGWSNFPIQELYAPLYYRLTLYAAASEEGGLIGHILGNPFQTTGNYVMDDVELQVDGQIIKPGVSVSGNGLQVNYDGKEWKTGFVEVRDGLRSTTIAMNLDRAESDFSEFGEEEIDEQLNEFDFSYVDAGGLSDQELLTTIQSTGFGREIWQWFLMAGMFFLVAESLISSFYKAEN
ncbi:BatA domain-containing protein [Balneola sp. MJW-20]|uniref:BatA domain-containing protein n=1 Tax=Gracilimonas aurantiaca TaxID=3234185 RepID=UPI003465B3E9